MTNVAARRLLVAARTIISRVETFEGSASWSRAAALLARQALEIAIDSFWAARHLNLQDCSMATKLTCLPWYVDSPALGLRAGDTWASLSSACHHHPYDLAPTAAELDAWLTDVDTIVGALEGSGA